VQIVLRSSLRSSYLVLVIAAGGWAGVRPLIAQDLPSPTQNAVAGAEVFGEKGCIRCHSISGGGQSLGPDLGAIGSTRTFQDLTATLWNHLPDMNRRMADLAIERPHLSAREAGDLFAYLYTLGYFDSAGDPERGNRLFTDLSCIRCHQIGGVGGVVGPVLDHVGARGVPIEVAAAMWNHAPAMMEAAEVGGVARPRMSGSDLADLIAYLRSTVDAIPGESLYVLPGDASAGARALVDRQCVECHGNPGEGGAIAPDLAGLSGGASLIDFVTLMWNKTPGMVSALRARELEFPNLKAEDFADIVAYLYSVNYFAAGGRASRGRALIDGKGCTRCHSIDSLATRPGLNHPSSLTAALWNHLAVLEAGEGAEANWPSFTGPEMQDLMAFFQASVP